MTATAVAAPSTERLAQAHKANQPKQSQTSAPSSQPAANTFAALLMLADVADEVSASSLNPATDPTATATTAPDTPTDETDDSVPPGQLALLGLMNWQNFVSPNAAVAGNKGESANPLATASNPATTISRPTSASTELVTTPTVAPLGNGLSSPTDATTAQAQLQPTDEAVPAEILAAMRAASPDGLDSATKNNASPRVVGAPGLVDAPGAKPKAGTLRHALSTHQATAGVSIASPSTVSLAFKTENTDVSSNAPAQLVGPAKTAPASEAGNPSSNGSAQHGERNDGAAIPELRASTPSEQPMVHAFAAGMESPGLDTNTAQAPDTPPALTPDNMEQTMEQLGAHISYWAAQGSQRASLTIGDNQNNPLGVNITFTNGEVNVHFETDQVDVKEALTLSAEDMLNHMLEAKGMTLGDVSIGAGQGGQLPSGQANQDTQGQNTPHGSTQMGTNRTRQMPSEPSLSAKAPRPAPVISANKLDFFA